MFNTAQLSYIIISFVLIALILVFSRKIKSQKNKDRFLKFWAVITFVIHISVMWVDYLTYGSASAPDSVLFPIYFCNACMYLLIVVAFMKNKQSKLFLILATFVAYGGFFGGLITTIESHYLAGNPVVWSWGNLKSMLSHSAMMVGCLYLFVGGYVKIGVKNLVYFVYGLLGCFVLGVFNNWLFTSVGLANPNSMYLTDTAIPGVPLLNGYFIASCIVVVIFIFTTIWEMFAYKKGQRWYNNFKKHFKKSK